MFVFLGVVVSTYTVAPAQIDPERAVDFGVVGVDFKVFHTFTYSNPTNKPVTIKPKNVPCECSTVRIEDSVVAPGGSTTVRLEYDTKNVFGRTAKEFTIATTDPANPVLEYYYASNVGQWILGIKPEPPSAFFLPAHKSKKIALANPRANSLRIALFDQADAYFEVRLLRGSASKGESAEIEIVPSSSLAKGTYYSSFRLLVTPSEGASPYYLSIPVKIVRY
ncbi:MAG: DUF1573 domain-containing protein [candidate division Zixibacteria bacterium]|nr:DUF1573 domain-containing protein [candidate division Zixibacteria bacterium]